MKGKIFCTTLGILLLSGCSTMKHSLVIGGITGAAAGTVTGAVIRPTDKKENAVTGALIGGLVGLAASYFIHGGLEKRDEKTRKELLLNLNRFGVGGVPKTDTDGNPALAKPVVNSEWVETRVKGNKLIEAHRVWVIEENSRWVPESGDQKEEESGR